MPCGPDPSVAGLPGEEVWVRRRLVVGRARDEATLDRTELVIGADDTASLVGVEQHARREGDAPPAELSFLEVGRRVLRGRAHRSATGLELALAGEASPPTLRHCTYERRRVAPAHAVRVRDPSFDAECGNRGVWMPSDLVEVTVLACASEGEDIGVRHLTFGRSPGIESLGISEGCFLQGEADRLVPPDGSLAPALPRRP